MQRYLPSMGALLGTIVFMAFILSPLSLYHSPIIVGVGATAVLATFLLCGFVLQRFWRYDS
jgi:hypothetical protein